MRYLLEAVLFAAAFVLAAGLFKSAVYGLIAGAILAGAWEALNASGRKPS